MKLELMNVEINDKSLSLTVITGLLHQATFKITKTEDRPEFVVMHNSNYVRFTCNWKIKNVDLLFTKIASVFINELEILSKDIVDIDDMSDESMNVLKSCIPKVIVSFFDSLVFVLMHTSDHDDKLTLIKRVNGRRGGGYNTQDTTYISAHNITKSSDTDYKFIEFSENSLHSDEIMILKHNKSLDLQKFCSRMYEVCNLESMDNRKYRFFGSNHLMNEIAPILMIE